MKQLNNQNIIKVEVFSSPGCSKCGRAKDVLHKIVAGMGVEHFQWREVNILEELDYATKLGVLSTPSIAIDGKLMFSHLPSSKKLKTALEKVLSSTLGGNL